MRNFIIGLLIVGAGVLDNVHAQCLGSFQWPDFTFTPTCSGSPQTINACNFAGDYAVLQLTAGTLYTFGSSISTDYLTVTTAGNTALTQGIQPLTFTPGSSGNYRLHIHSNASCGTNSTCRITTVQCGTPPPPPPPPPAIEYLSFFHWTNGQLSATNWQSDTDPVYFGAIGSKNGCVFADVTITNSGPWVGTGHPRYAYNTIGMPAAVGYGMRLEANWTDVNQQIVYTITFKDGNAGPISEFLTNFSIYDVNSHVCGATSANRFIDEVQVIGYRANLTTAVNPNLTPATNSGGVLCSDNQIIGNVIKGATTCGNSRLNVDFGSTPVARVQIIYRSGTGHPANQNCGTNPNGLVLGNDPRAQLILLSSFAVTGGCVTLPVEFNQFNVSCVNNQARLNWSTYSELNNDYFTIERSSDGYVFEEIAQVSGSGTTNQLSPYQWVDDRPLTGLSYYRLSQTDYDGTRTLLKTVSFVNDCSALNFAIEVYPNPTVNESIIKLILPEDTELALKLYDSGGRLIREILPAQAVLAGVVELTLPTHELSNGVYIIQASANKEIITHKLLK